VALRYVKVQPSSLGCSIGTGRKYLPTQYPHRNRLSVKILTSSLMWKCALISSTKKVGADDAKAVEHQVGNCQCET
jgi:hypothetical protein